MLGNRRFRKFLVVGAMGLILLFPSIAWGEEGEEGLVPDCGTATEDCTWEDLIQLIDNIISQVIILAVPVATGVIAYAGFLYTTTGIAGKKEKAKKMLWSVGTGLAVLLGAWIIMNTIISVILRPDFQEAIPLEK